MIDIIAGIAIKPKTAMKEVVCPKHLANYKKHKFPDMRLMPNVNHFILDKFPYYAIVLAIA